MGIAAEHTVKLFNGDETVDDNGTTSPVVFAVVEAPDAASWAEDMGSIERTLWQSDGSDFAYASFPNTSGLIARLENEGYRLDASEFIEAS